MNKGARPAARSICAV